MHPDYRNVHINIAGQELLERLWIQMEIVAPKNNPFRRMMKRWGSIYQAAMRRRFIQQSRGGWERLAESTLKRRRTGRGGKPGETRGVSITRLKRERSKLEAKTRARFAAGRGSRGKLFGGSFKRQAKLDEMIDNLSNPANVAVLVDTGQLRDALKPGKEGSLADDIPWGTDVGFSRAFHEVSTDTLSVSPVTFGDLAAFHHFGMGNNPERPILVDPNWNTEILMLKEFAKANKSAAKKMAAFYRKQQRGNA